VSKHPTTRDLSLASAKIFSATKPTQQTFEIEIEIEIFSTSENHRQQPRQIAEPPPQRLDQDGKLLTTFL
jgi:hypothetical protein